MSSHKNIVNSDIVNNLDRESLVSCTSERISIFRLILLRYQIYIIYFVRRFLIVFFKLVKPLENLMKFTKERGYEKRVEYYQAYIKINKKSEYNINKKPSNKVVYTVLTGDYDNLTAQYYYDTNWHYICFTDNETLIKNGHPFWKIVPFDAECENSAQKSRLPKILAHKFLKDYQYSLYIDANVNLLSKKIYKKLDELIKKQVKFAVSSHFQRNCIYDEMLVCIQLGKDSIEKILNLCNKYKKEGFPEKYGLTENNVIFRDHNDETVKKITEDWWYMLKNYSKRDQLSLMYICWKNNYKIQPILKKPLRFYPDDFIVFYHKYKAEKR